MDASVINLLIGKSIDAAALSPEMQLVLIERVRDRFRHHLNYISGFKPFSEHEASNRERGEPATRIPVTFEDGLSADTRCLSSVPRSHKRGTLTWGEGDFGHELTQTLFVTMDGRLALWQYAYARKVYRRTPEDEMRTGSGHRARVHELKNRFYVPTREDLISQIMPEEAMCLLKQIQYALTKTREQRAKRLQEDQRLQGFIDAVVDRLTF